jgi:exosortase
MATEPAQRSANASLEVIGTQAAQARPSWSRELRELFVVAREWCGRNPTAALLCVALVATLVYFFGFVRFFATGTLSTFVWAWQAWNPEINYEHARLIPLIFVFLVWTSRNKLKNAPLGSSRWGWLFIGIGLFLFFAGARTVQARFALTALPFLLFGGVLYVCGKAVARVLLFPIAFLFFMVPLNFLTQSTVKLQLLETGVATAVCRLFGLGVYRLGTVISAANDAFRFQVDEGCSGIRSLMAITMLSAIFAHFTQDRLWKKLTIFAAAIVFAIIGNAGRLVSIIVIARLFGQDLAGGPYHIISGYLSFPFAIAAMYLLGRLLNLKTVIVRSPPGKPEAAAV